MEIKENNEQSFSHNKVRILILVSVFICVVAVIIWLFRLGYDAPRGQAVELITKDIALKDNATQQDLATIIAFNFKEYKRNTFWWNLAYDACIFLAAILSAFAGVIFFYK